MRTAQDYFCQLPEGTGSHQADEAPARVMRILSDGFDLTAVRQVRRALCGCISAGPCGRQLDTGCYWTVSMQHYVGALHHPQWSPSLACAGDQSLFSFWAIRLATSMLAGACWSAARGPRLC